MDKRLTTPTLKSRLMGLFGRSEPQAGSPVAGSPVAGSLGQDRVIARMPLWRRHAIPGAAMLVVACLGLFGLAAFTAGRRTKEIGIRKVFGARTRDVILLLLWQFSLPVLLANLIAWPIAWYYLHGFLQGYAYRISMNPLYFLGVGLVAMAIAWVTIFGHALKVARANPIRALRYE